MPFGAACDVSHNIQRIIIYYAHEYNFTVNIKIKKTLNKFWSKLLPKANNNFRFNLKYMRRRSNSNWSQDSNSLSLSLQKYRVATFYHFLPPCCQQQLFDTDTFKLGCTRICNSTEDYTYESQSKERTWRYLSSLVCMSHLDSEPKLPSASPRGGSHRSNYERWPRLTHPAPESCLCRVRTQYTVVRSTQQK